MARTRTRTFRVVPDTTRSWDLFLKDFLNGLEDVELADMADLSGLSVMGRASNTSGEPAAITAGNDGDILRRSGTTLGFGSILASSVSDFAENSRDTIASFIVNGTGISWVHDDVANTFTGSVTLAPFSTTNLAEGANLYFTDERAQDAVGAALTDSATIDLTYTDASNAITATVIDDSISNAKLENMAQATIKGRASGAGTGDPTDLSAAQAAAIVSTEVASALNITSGVYTPTLTNVTNVAASSALQCQYMRVGSVVTVSGRLTVDPTAAVLTELGISLPIASNIGAAEDVGGVAFANLVAGQGAAILGDTTNDRAQMTWVAVDTANRAMSFIFQYRVI